MTNPASKHRRFRWCILMAIGAVVAGVNVLHAQSPLTADSLKSILSEVARTSHQVDSLNRLDANVQAKAKALIAAFAAHNAESCEYPQGQPELCANYDLERLDLNLRSADLQKEMKVIATPLRAARAQFAELMTRLRTAAYSPSLAGQKEQIVGCTNLNGVAEAAACLARSQRPVRRPPV